MPASPNTNNSIARTVPRLSAINYPDVCPENESESRTRGSPTASGSHRKPLHQSSPALRTDPCFPPLVETGSRSNPTMSSFKGMSRMKPHFSHHQHNASFLLHHHYHDRRSLHAIPRTAATGKPACRNTVVGLDKIVQRSSSKSVKQTLRQLEAMCGDPEHGTPPWREVEMLLELSTDIYYRVVMKKCRGVEILTLLRQTFPQLQVLCDQLLKAMDIPDESTPSPRSTRTTVLIDSNMEASSMESTGMQVDQETSEDIRQIIRDGCQQIIW